MASPFLRMRNLPARVRCLSSLKLYFFDWDRRLGIEDGWEIVVGARGAMKK